MACEWRGRQGQRLEWLRAYWAHSPTINKPWLWRVSTLLIWQRSHQGQPTLYWETCGHEHSATLHCCHHCRCRLHVQLLTTPPPIADATASFTSTCSPPPYPTLLPTPAPASSAACHPVRRSPPPLQTADTADDFLTSGIPKTISCSCPKKLCASPGSHFSVIHAVHVHPKF